MSEGMNLFVLYLQTSVQMGTHILLATLGAILCEKVGHINLGVEGMMLLGAVLGFGVAHSTGSAALALAAAMLAGMLGALIYAFITVTLGGNQVVTGLVLSIFGAGVSGLYGRSLSGVALPQSVLSVFAAFKVPGLSGIPVLGKIFFEQSAYVMAAPLLALAVYVYLFKTNVGMNTRIVGESPAAADASGIPVTRYKYLNILMGGALCGLGGAYLSLVFVPRWQANITAGAGWIAVALVIFSTWNPLKAILGAYLFGALRGVAFITQNADLRLFGVPLKMSSQLVGMIPYAATILVLVLISMRRRQENQPPKGLGVAYYREER